MSKEIVKNYGKSIRSRLLNIAESEDIYYQTVLTRYFQERLIYRISQTSYRQNFYLKGGALMYAHEKFAARPTLDIDFLGNGISNNEEKIVAAFREICSVPCEEDGVRYDVEHITSKNITELKDYHGVRLSIPVSMDTVAQIMTMDIGFGDVVTPAPVELEYPALLDNLPAANILAYSLETVVAGDCGFGFEKPGYYEQVFNRNAPRLSKSNNWIIMIRGNHDDPSYFSEERISHQRFRTIPDYSVIQACGHNILCVGGAVSIDRMYRKEHDSRHPAAGTASYWENEMPIFDEYALNDIGQKFKIDTVVTHTSPSFCELISKTGLSEWAARDSNLLDDCDNERRTMDHILEHLKSQNHPLSHWFYGHFHQSWSSCIDGILFSMLDIMEVKELH